MRLIGQDDRVSVCSCCSGPTGLSGISLLAMRAGIWDADLVIFGHTHQFWDTTFQRGKIRLINPGCLVGDPKASIRAYGNYEICSFSLLRIGDRGEIDVEHLYL